MARLNYGLLIVTLSWSVSHCNRQQHRSSGHQPQEGYAKLVDTTVNQQQQQPGKEDPFLWLEEVEGPKALQWVDDHNAATLQRLQNAPLFDRLYEDTLAILSSDERLALATIRGGFAYNFWQDKSNPRGIWRRMPVAAYKAKLASWDILLDVDALAAAEGESWVYKGSTCLRPAYNRCLVSLSRGGKDAHVVREYDLTSKSFVSDGFVLPETKGGAAWVDADTVFLADDLTEAHQTKSGYARVIRKWQRGEEAAAATIIFKGEEEDVRVDAATIYDDAKAHHFIFRSLTFYTQRVFALLDSQLVPLALPDDANLLGVFKGELLVSLRSDWQPAANQELFRQGSLISLPFAEFVNGGRRARLIFAPDATSALTSVDKTSEKLVVNIAKNVHNEVITYLWLAADERWQAVPLPVPPQGSIAVLGVSEESEDFWLTYESFLQNKSLYFVDGGDLNLTLSRFAPAFFDASGLEVTQEWGRSQDGTAIPYYLVRRKGQKENAPTLLYGYGGFEVSLNPFYLAKIGKSWLERGGVFALANIRGGGEFGPAWHQAALKHKRMRAFEDFIAVAEDLIDRGVTSADRLGIMGGSNGGLLVGASFVLRPDLFKAVVCQVPLLDMQRYHKLLAGNSWMAEYGNPDEPGDWDYIKRYSPYHNLKGAIPYPHVLFTTSTKDDRVHPGHARKMAAKMEALGSPVSYYENREGGHAGSADYKQAAFMSAVEFSFLAEQLGL